MIKTWIIICDSCGREIDATKEHFIETDGEQLCQECAEQ